MRQRRRRVITWAVVPVLTVGLWLLYRGLYPRHYRVTILSSLGGNHTAPYAINDHGQIVGVAETEKGDHHLVLWDQERKLHDLGSIGESLSRFDINNTGQIAGAMKDPNGHTRGFLRDPNGRIEWLPTFAGGGCYVRALNNRGQIVGSSKVADGSSLAFLWDKAGGIRDLGTLNGKESQARAINDNGQVFGFSGDLFFGTRTRG